MRQVVGLADHRRRVTAAGLLALGLVAGACSGGGGGDEAGQLSVGSPDSTAAPAATASTTTSPGPGPAGPATTVDGSGPDATGGSTTTEAPRPGPDGPDPAPVPPARAGTYTYATRGQVDLGLGSAALAPTSELVVEPAAGDRQRSVRTMGDGGGFTLRTELVLELRADGVYLVFLAQTARALVFGEGEELLPPSPVLLVATDDGPGQRRRLEVPTTTGSATLVVTVEDPDRVRVGSTTVDVTVVRIEATLQGANSGTIDQVLSIDGQRGLIVAESATVRVGPARIDYEVELNSLTPR